MKGLKNCHTVGLHSIVLREHDDGCLTRMFFTTPEHDMWKNALGTDGYPIQPLSIAIHPHHVDIQLTVLTGCLTNILVELRKSNEPGINMAQYKWHSYISKQGGHFERMAAARIRIQRITDCIANDRIFMKSSELHTVYVEKGLETAWIIEEFPASDGYDSVNYSNCDLTTWTPDGLYIPMSQEEIAESLAKIILKSKS